jgi:cytochrome c
MKSKTQLLAMLVVCSVASSQAPAQGQRGNKLFRESCIGCHSVACNRLGPKLEGLFGRKAGSVADFKGYSPELQASGIVWTDETLDNFLRDPVKMVPGTSMSFVGRIEKTSDRKDLIAFMRRQDRSFDLCP